jgi:hypothetical protein
MKIKMLVWVTLLLLQESLNISAATEDSITTYRCRHINKEIVLSGKICHLTWQLATRIMVE